MSPPAPSLLGPPLLEPPLDILEPNPVPTDPRRRIFAFEEEKDGWLLRLVWDSDEPQTLEAECRIGEYGYRPSPELIRRFHAAVREKTSVLGPLRVLAADPPARRP